MIYKDLTLSTIRSGKGECIHLSFGNYNLIIDSGPALAAGAFRKLCESIMTNGESINTLIITHYDGDHIGGIIKVGDTGFHSIYFNAYDGIIENENLTAEQNQRLFHMLPSAIVHSSIVAGDMIEIGDAIITVHAPTNAALSRAKKLMKEEDKLLGVISDWCFSLDELMERPYPSQDKSISNQASIVFTFEFGSCKFLFTGDAWNDSIPGGKYDLVKLPHHGSARNITDEMIKRLDTNTFLICADGTSHPNKQTIAKLLRLKDKITIYSNYDWWMKGFLKAEDVKYIDSGKLEFKLT